MRGGRKDKNFLESESPLFLGRAVVALAGDPSILERSGQLFSSWELGREYRFTDVDGRRPDWGAIEIDFSKHPQELLQLISTGSEIQLRWLSEMMAEDEAVSHTASTDEDRGWSRYADGIGQD